MRGVRGTGGGLNPIEQRIGDRAAVLRVDARVWLREASLEAGRPVDLGSVLPSRSGLLLEEGFGWLWLGGIWDPGETGRWIARRSALLLERFREDLPDLEISDIDGPALPPRAYTAREDLGGDEGLETLRRDLQGRGIRLLVDFVPDCVAADHPWVTEHPEFILHSAGGPCPEEAAAPALPALPAATLDLGHPGVQEAVMAELDLVARRADGIHLAGRIAPEARGFWSGALGRLRAAHPRLMILGEPPASAPASSLTGSSPPVDVDLGLDVEIDAGFRDLGMAPDPAAIPGAVKEGTRRPCARFLEEYGGARVTERLPRARHEAAAVLAYLSASLAVFSDGEIEGRKRPWNPFLTRRAAEPPDGEIRSFYGRLLDVLGRPAARSPCRVLPLSRAWEENESWRQVTVLTRGEMGKPLLLVAVNFGPAEAQCYASVEGLLGESGGWLLQDLFSTQVYTRDRGDLAQRGLYLALAPWDYNVFEVTPRPAG